MTSASTTFEIPAQLDSIGRVRDLVEERALKAGLEEVAASLYALSCVEAFTNIVRHANVPPDGVPIRLVIKQLDDELQVDFVHHGQHYEPTAQLPDLDLDDYPEGGFGRTIMHEASDSVEYLRGEQANTVRLKKRLARQ